MTSKTERAENKAIQAQAKELRELLGEFGARLSGWDPGVSAYLPNSPRGMGYMGESLTFDGAEWSWLKPLLEELRDRRKSAPRRPGIEKLKVVGEMWVNGLPAFSQDKFNPPINTPKAARKQVCPKKSGWKYYEEYGEALAMKGKTVWAFKKA